MPDYYERMFTPPELEALEYDATAGWNTPGHVKALKLYFDIRAREWRVVYFYSSPRNKNSVEGGQKDHCSAERFNFAYQKKLYPGS